MAAGIQGRRQRKLAGSSRCECVLRLASGAVDGLSSRWRGCLAQVGRNSVTFVPLVPPGTRFRRPFTTEITFQVVTVSPSERRIAWTERLMGPAPGNVVMELQTDGGLVEMGVGRAHAGWIVRALEDSPDPLQAEAGRSC